MTDAGTGQGGGMREEGCLGLETLEQLVHEPGGPVDPKAQQHLELCERCRDLLAEMRKADQFLERFRSCGSDEMPAEHDHGLVRIPGYNVLGLIAFGGQGAVYRAVQQGTGRAVAIKVPIGDAIRRASTRYRFEREIELTARLDHPGIVRVLGACTLADGRLGCVMEYVEGEPFDRWASRERARGQLRSIARSVSGIADAIAYAHQRAVIHRDIKPSNVIVMADGEPRVLDFGLAKAIGEEGSSFATLTGAFVGTLVYSAPEQVVSGARSIDLRTDVYALGLLLFQALTGRLPYESDLPPGELVRCIRDQPTVCPSVLGDGIGSELDAIVTRAMAKEPERRYQSAGELRDDLEAWLEGRAVSAKKDSKLYVLRKSAWRHRRPLGLVAVLLTAMCVVIVAGVVSRAQVARAELAGAVRDARTIESHWARMADLRSVGLDNFEAGEFGAWDAMLAPDRALVDRGIEGLIAREDQAGGAAYWALWEIYLKSPVLYSVPAFEGSLSAIDPGTGTIAKIAPASGAIRWWDPRSGELVRELYVGDIRGAISFSFSPSGNMAVMTLADGRLLFIDTVSGRVQEPDQGSKSYMARIAEDRVLSGVRGGEGVEARLKLWDISSGSPELIREIQTTWPTRNTVIDASMRYAAVLAERGQLSVIDMRDGAMLLRRVEETQPRFLMVQSRGIAGEFLLFGGSVMMSLRMQEDGGDFVMISDAGVFSDGARQVEHARETDRIVTVTDRYRIEIGSNTAVRSEHFFPALSVSTITVAPDGAYASGLARPSGRSVAFDIAARSIQRLPFPADTTQSGFATIPSVCFSADSASLFAGGMDGTIRCFDTQRGEERWRTPRLIPTGVNILRAQEDDVYIGSHDLALNNATLGRIRDGQYQELLAGPNRWYSGIELGPEGRLWALTGSGRLMRIDSELGTIERETQLKKHADNPTVRALARLEQYGVLIAGPAESGVVLLDENTLAAIGDPVPMAPIRELAVSPADPGLIASAGDDGVVRLWRFEQGAEPSLRLTREMGTHAGPVFCIAFSPDGRRIASGGGSPESRDVRIWDVEHGKELASLNLFQLGVFGLAFSPDGRWLAASGEVDPGKPAAGGELYLIDLRAPDRCIAGNLEYHVARLTAEHGQEPELAEAFRAWAETLP